jgi:chlorobactene glucosyltransferase
MLKKSASAMLTERADLISALPCQVVVTWSERLAVPAFYVGLLCGVLLELNKLTKNPPLFAALGQFMIFSRRAYNAVGGYAAVRQNIVDDIAIGRRVHAAGMRYMLMDGCGAVSCRMYRGLEQTWRGLTKSTYATFNFSPPLLIAMYLLVLLMLVEPPLLLIIGLVAGLPALILLITAVAVLLALLLFVICYRRFRFPLYLALLYPASAVFMTVIAFASMILTLQGKALWKGRIMPKTVNV